ncbi:hypothetical protein CEP54_012475 [Fusarium duplospermum]|uniref:Uncharacterized protein n=1 Tax=Fusarium duplospermum TaxID=1325734 RepID=A0A428P8J8_9HYPO|nr:hypothetical protein CEP54_012475 [Fusarium duplospermum]
MQAQRELDQALISKSRGGLCINLSRGKQSEYKKQLRAALAIALAVWPGVEQQTFRSLFPLIPIRFSLCELPSDLPSASHPSAIGLGGNDCE